MRFRFPVFLPLVLAALSLPGCASNHDRVKAIRPDGGPSRVFGHAYDVVFPAALRVMHLHNEQIEEARPDTGRIVSLQPLGSRAVFLTKLPGERTRVELSSSMYLWRFGRISGGPEAFFDLLGEQIAIYEKKKIREERMTGKKVDPELRTIFNPRDRTKKSPPPEPEPTPPTTRRQRLRLRR